MSYEEEQTQCKWCLGPSTFHEDFCSIECAREAGEK